MSCAFSDLQLLSGQGIPASTLFSRVTCEALATDPPKRLLDIGCGSGVIGLYTLLNGADFVCFNDIQPAATALTQQNLAQHHISTSRYQILSHPFQQINLDQHDINGNFDAITFNPPQLPTASVPMTQFEQPSERIFRDGGDNGRKLIDQYIHWLGKELPPSCTAYLGMSSLLAVDEVLALAQSLSLTGIKKHRVNVPLRQILHPVAQSMSHRQRQQRDIDGHNDDWHKKIYVLQFNRNH